MSTTLEASVAVLVERSDTLSTRLASVEKTLNNGIKERLRAVEEGRLSDSEKLSWVVDSVQKLVDKMDADNRKKLDRWVDWAFKIGVAVYFGSKFVS